MVVDAARERDLREIGFDLRVDLRVGHLGRHLSRARDPFRRSFPSADAASRLCRRPLASRAIVRGVVHVGKHRHRERHAEREESALGIDPLAAVVDDQRELGGAAADRRHAEKSWASGVGLSVGAADGAGDAASEQRFPRLPAFASPRVPAVDSRRVSRRAGGGAASRATSRQNRR